MNSNVVIEKRTADSIIGNSDTESALQIVMTELLHGHFQAMLPIALIYEPCAQQHQYFWRNGWKHDTFSCPVNFCVISNHHADVAKQHLCHNQHVIWSVIIGVCLRLSSHSLCPLTVIRWKRSIQRAPSCWDTQWSFNICD